MATKSHLAFARCVLRHGGASADRPRRDDGDRGLLRLAGVVQPAHPEEGIVVLGARHLDHDRDPLAANRGGHLEAPFPRACGYRERARRVDAGLVRERPGRDRPRWSRPGRAALRVHHQRAESELVAGADQLSARVHLEAGGLPGAAAAA